jgi:hypothetical protein
MLAYQMGERLGALGKTDEAVRETIGRLQADADRARQATTDAMNDLRAAEVALEHQREQQTRLQVSALCDCLRTHARALMHAYLTDCY